MDKRNHKYKNWVFTFNANEKGHLPDEGELEHYLSSKFDKFAFQREKGEETGRLHYQGQLRTKIRSRHLTVLRMFEQQFPETVINFTVNKMEGDWDESLVYCSKEETRDGKSFHCSPTMVTYDGQDIKFLGGRKTMHPWQVKMFDFLFEENSYIYKTPDDRRIFWISDKKGCSGKSKFVKFICHNTNSSIKIPFGTAAQLRSSVVNAGPHKLYFIDIPRTLGDDDSINSIISVLEDIKNGFVVSSMYGKYQQLMFNPPHIVVFSNLEAPVEKMSTDRWVEKTILSNTKDFYEHVMPYDEE